MKKLSSYLLGAVLSVFLFTSCSDDDVQPEAPAITISNIFVDGNPISLTGENNFPTKDSGNMAISLSLSSGKVSSYNWQLNGKVVSRDSAYFINTTWSGAYNFELTLKNEDSIATTKSFTINLNGPYKDGIFFYGTTFEDLAFFNPVTSTFYEGNIYEKVNGHMLGINDRTGGINDLFIHDNKLYLLSPNDNNSRAKISVCDAQTLKEYRTIYTEGFTISDLGQIYNLIAINENKFYIVNNNSGESNTAGINVLMINEDGSIVFTQGLKGVKGKLGVDGPTWMRMFKSGKYVLAGCGSKLQVIDSETDQIFKTIEIDATRQIADIIEGRDGKIYVFIAGSAQKSGDSWLWSPDYTSSASVVTIDPTDFSNIDETFILENGERIDIKSGLSGCYAVASRTSDELFFVDNGEWMISSKIYKYNYVTKTTSLFVALSYSQAQNGISGYLETDKNGLLYVPTTNYKTSAIMTFNISDGSSQSSPISTRINGDAGMTSTSRFK